MATATKTLTDKLDDFVRVRNESGFQSNFQFQTDAEACGVWDSIKSATPEAYGNVHLKAYVWRIREDAWLVDMGRCGWGASRFGAFRAATDKGVNALALAKELGFPTDANT